MTQKDNGGPAFPTSDGQFVYSNGMSLRAYAAIHLQQPDSGIDWLDAMILSAKRDAMAEQALAGFGANPETYSWEYVTMARAAYAQADAMLKGREK